MTLDASYRLAHLPLVAPAHPKLIASKPGTPYQMGRHDAITSLVLPIPDSLYETRQFLALKSELQAAPFAAKIAWHILEARRCRLHATICGSLASGEHLPPLNTNTRARLALLGPWSVELRGLFSGSLNHGRLYLKAYPQRRGTENAIDQIQKALGARVTNLYPVGLFNLIDDLNAVETDALGQLIDRWWDRSILRSRVDRLWLMSARDDLVLDAEITEVIPLA